MTRPIQQHFVTRAYLEGFADANGQLHVYERGREGPFSLTPAKAARQRNYYSFKNKDGKFDDQIERFLDEQVESPAMAVIRKLVQNEEQLPWNERVALARWIAFQEFRTPLQREGIEQTAQKLIETTMQMLAVVPGVIEEALEKLNEQGKEYGVTAEDVRKGIEADAFRIRINPMLSLETMTVAEEVVPILAEMKWTLVTAANGVQFVTSDHPVLRHDPDEHNPYRYGLASDTIELGLPLNAKNYLVITHDRQRQKQWLELKDAGKDEEARALRSSTPVMAVHRLSAENTLKLRDGIIRSAPRFIYCPDEDPRYVEVLAKEPWTLRWHVG